MTAATDIKERLRKKVDLYEAWAPVATVEISKIIDRIEQLERDLAEANTREANDYNALLDDRNRLNSENIRAGNRIAELEVMVAAQAQEPVARLIHWNGPAHGYIPANCVSARTFTEFSKEDCEKAKHYWKEGELLYTSPPAPASLSLVKAALEAAAKIVDNAHWQGLARDIRAIDPQTIINEASK